MSGAPAMKRFLLFSIFNRVILIHINIHVDNDDKSLPVIFVAIGIAYLSKLYQFPCRG